MNLKIDLPLGTAEDMIDELFLIQLKRTLKSLTRNNFSMYEDKKDNKRLIKATKTLIKYYGG